MKKNFTFKLMLLLCALIVGSNAWATEYISYNGNTQDACTTISSSNVSSGSAGKISWKGIGCSYSSNRVNITAGGSITFTAASGYVITKIVITSGSSSAYYGTWTSTPSVDPTSSSGVTTFDGLSANEVTVTTSTDFRCTNTSHIKIYYEAAPTTTDPTITFNNGSVRVGRTLNLSTLFTSNSAGAVTYSITAGDSYATLDGSTLTGVAEGSVTVKAAQAAAGDYNAGEATATITVNPALVLSSIAITTAPTKTTYTEGETFDPTGMVVTATYSNFSTEDVTALCTYSPTTALSTSDTEITVSYTENAVETTVKQAITVNPLPTYTVTYSDGGSVTEASYGAGVTLASRSGNDTYTFAGWSTTNNESETTDVPTIIPTNETYYPNANITLYPVYTRSVAGGTKWKKITNLSTTESGVYALITSSNKAFSSINGSGHGTITENAFSFDENDEADSAPVGTCELTLTAVKDANEVVLGYTMYNSTNKYLYASKAASGGLAWHAEESSYWSYTNSKWIYNVSYNSVKAMLRAYESNTPHTFRTYSSNTSNGVNFVFVKKVSGSVTYYVSKLSSISAPTFDPTSQNFSTASLSVAISVASDCVINYTTDNWEHTTETTSNTVTIEITGTTTVKAKAKKGGSFSAEVSQTYTKVYNVTLSSNGVAASPIEVVSGQSTTLTTPSTVPSGYSFIHWTETPETPDTPVSNTYTPTANITLYAVYGKNTYGNFEKVTSSLDDYSGNYLIVYNNNYALNTHYGNVNADTYATYTDISDYYSVISGVNTITYNETTAGLIVVAAKTANGFSLYDTDGYLGDNSSGTGSKLRWDTGFTAEQDEWTLGVNSIVNVKNTSNAIRWNNNSGQYRFAIYATTGQQAIMLYKLKVTSIDGFYIQAYPTNSTTTATANIIISGKTVIESGATLNMGSYTLANGNAANLIIEDGGQLIVHNDNVQATIKKTVTASAKTATNWYTIASPVRNVNIGAVGDAGSVNNLKEADGKYDLYRFNETKNDVGTNLRWENYKNSAYHDGGADDFTSLESGRGYLYRREGTATLEYVGEVNGNASETYTLTVDGAAPLTGFHLIGNPYSHDIYKGKGAAIDDTKLNEGFYRLTNGTAWTPALGWEDPIHSGEGILVQANATGTLTIYNSTTEASGESKYNDDNIIFSVSNSQHKDVAYAVFDKGHGLNKIEHRDDNIPMLYISQNGEDYAIAMMSDETKTFGLSLKATTMGQYTLKLKANGSYTYLHVIDRLTGEDVDMFLEDEYTFVASANDIRERFIVKLGYMPDYSDAENDVIAYQSGDQILVSGEGELQIFDVTGRKVMTTTINGVEAISGLQQGVYIFRVIGETQKTQKIVVR